MTIIKWYLITGWLCLLIFSKSDGQQSVSGLVLGFNDVPIEGVEVIVWSCIDSNKILDSTVTKVNGEFSILCSNCADSFVEFYTRSGDYHLGMFKALDIENRGKECHLTVKLLPTKSDTSFRAMLDQLLLYEQYFYYRILPAIRSIELNSIEEQDFRLFMRVLRKKYLDLIDKMPIGYNWSGLEITMYQEFYDLIYRMYSDTE